MKLWCLGFFLVATAAIIGLSGASSNVQANASPPDNNLAAVATIAEIATPTTADQQNSTASKITANDATISTAAPQDVTANIVPAVTDANVVQSSTASKITANDATTTAVGQTTAAPAIGTTIVKEAPASGAQ